MNKEFVITVMSVDRAGIIRDVSRAVLDLEGNIGALSQTVMKGYFTIILTASFDEKIEGEMVAEAIREMGRPGELGVQIKERDPEVEAPVVEEAERFVLTVTGPDRKGIIQRITSHLASRGVNIEDLYAVAEGDEFLLIAQLEMPPGTETERMQMEVQHLWPAAEVEVSLQHENIFLATSNVDFRHVAPARGDVR